MSTTYNDHLVLLAGKSATGKSLSLRNLRDPAGVMYLNTESNKRLPFKSVFKQYNITDPFQIYEAFDYAEENADVHTIVVDSLTYMMDMFETVYVTNSANGLKAWGDYATFFKTLMSQYVAKSTKNVIFTAHTLDILNESEMTVDTMVKVKGSLMNNGIESYFSTVISSKKVPLKYLEGSSSDMLNITEEEKELGFKYVFQTKLTKNTVNERIRSPFGLWTNEQTFIDNDLEIVMQHLSKYYD